MIKKRLHKTHGMSTFAQRIITEAITYKHCADLHETIERLKKATNEHWKSHSIVPEIIMPEIIKA